MCVYVRVRVYAYVHVCARVCMRAYTYVRIYVRARVCPYACACVYAHICMHACACVCVNAYMCVRVCECIHVRTRVRVCMCACARICVRAYVCVHMRDPLRDPPRLDVKQLRRADFREQSAVHRPRRKHTSARTTPAITTATSGHVCVCLVRWVVRLSVCSSVCASFY